MRSGIQLKDSGKGSLLLAATYTSLVDDPQIKAVWCAAVVNFARVRQGELSPDEYAAVAFAKDCAIRYGDLGIDGGIETVPAAGSPAAAGTGIEGVVETSGDPLGWDIDVFSCDTSGSDSADAAKKIATHLTGLSSRGQKLGDQRLGRVRYKKVSREREERGGLPAGLNQIRTDGNQDEQQFAEVLKKEVASASGRNFTVGRSYQGTAWYVSVFACGK